MQRVHQIPQELIQLLKHRRVRRQVTSRHKAGGGEEHGGGDDRSGAGGEDGDGGGTSDEGPVRVVEAPPLPSHCLALLFSMEMVLEMRWRWMTVA
jgi:hypothetical protein